MLEVTATSSKDDDNAVNEVDDTCNEFTVEFAMFTSELVPRSEIELKLEVSVEKLRFSEKLVMVVELEFRSDRAETLEPAIKLGVDE